MGASSSSSLTLSSSWSFSTLHSVVMRVCMWVCTWFALTPFKIIVFFLFFFNLIKSLVVLFCYILYSFLYCFFSFCYLLCLVGLILPIKYRRLLLLCLCPESKLKWEPLESNCNPLYMKSKQKQCLLKTCIPCCLRLYEDYIKYREKVLEYLVLLWVYVCVILCCDLLWLS